MSNFHRLHADCISPNPWRASTNIYLAVWPDSGRCAHTPSKDQRINRMDRKPFGGLRSAPSPNKLTVTADLFPRLDEPKNLNSHSVARPDRSVSPRRRSLFNLFSGFVDTTGVLLATGVLLVWLIYRVEYQLLNWLFFFFPLSLRRVLKSIRRH